LAQEVLKIDPYHDELALRLAILLTMESRFRTSGTYEVKNLLEALLPQTVIDEARSDYDKARKLTNRWNHALAALMELRQAFLVEFDPKTYLEDLRPGSKARKPRGYFEQLLAAKITIHPPMPIPELLATKTKPKSTQPKLKHSKRIELTETQLRNARKAKGWSQAKLAGWLEVTQAFISQVEKGDRILSGEMKTKLKKLLDIQD
jgi:DNA-binding XRE family transcriptional regulator